MSQQGLDVAGAKSPQHDSPARHFAAWSRQPLFSRRVPCQRAAAVTTRRRGSSQQRSPNQEKKLLLGRVVNCKHVFRVIPVVSPTQRSSSVTMVFDRNRRAGACTCFALVSPWTCCSMAVVGGGKESQSGAVRSAFSNAPLSPAGTLGISVACAL
jgi:hypothetical protein